MNNLSKPQSTSLDFWKKPRPFWLSLSVLVVFAVAAFLIVNWAATTRFSERIGINEKPEIASIKVQPLAEGKRIYEAMPNNSKTFKIIKVEIDPLDVKRGDTQIVTVFVEDTENNPITKENKVEATVYQDKSSTPFSFLLKKAEGPDTSIITTWQGSWVSEDSHNYRYMMNITAERIGEKHSIDLSFR